MLSAVVLAFAAATNVAFAATSVSRPPESTLEPSLTQILATEATQAALSPVSNVAGKGFDRIVQIWLENTDYDKAAGDPNMQWLASQGITLTNYWATTHPSEPNYCAVVGGDNFGMDNDDFNTVPANVSTVVDLLDTKGISWGEYQEGSPYAGFQGFNYSNQANFANMYVRKHNPLILYDSVTSNATRLSLIKNFTSFSSDLAAKTLPQWSFVTPNMTNDGHDTTITFAANWARSFLAPLLNNTYFMNNTLIVLTFDETETYTVGNKIFTILLGGAIPSSLKNTTDNTFYNHYSMLSTVEVNWDLPSLGRWDCGANVLEIVANKTGYDNYVVDTSNLFFNSSYPGPLSDARYVLKWPVPNTGAFCAAGKGVLSSVASTWGKSNGTYNYTNPYPYNDASGNDVGGSISLSTPTPTGSTSGTPSGSASGTPTGSSTGAASSASKSSVATSNGASFAAVAGAFSWAAIYSIFGM
ncbi:phosphoesterase-domain-containing protein [Glonium stellatum]|uniref:acid phosphatase n=1 Tax=Glonium stellatum TaxID=574774 RepID=A0A8E2JXX0_9PEZI|nr:phosphoesterase-domain-containing protein [Glonium stellatum]